MCESGGRRFGQGEAILLKPPADALLRRLGCTLTKVTFVVVQWVWQQRIERRISSTSPSEWASGQCQNKAPVYVAVILAEYSHCIKILIIMHSVPSFQCTWSVYLGDSCGLYVRNLECTSPKGLWKASRPCVGHFVSLKFSPSLSSSSFDLQLDIPSFRELLRTFSIPQP